MTNQRIAIVANTTWNIYNFRLNVIRKLIAEGNEIVVMAPVDKFISYREAIPEVDHVPIRHLHRDSVNPIRDMRLFFELMRLYKKYKPDIVLHYTVKPNIYGGLAARMLRIPSMAVITGLGYSLMHEGWINHITRFLYKISLPLHRKVLFENRDDQQMFEKEKLISSDMTLSIKGCGVDTGFFSPNGIVEKGPFVTFTFIGRLLYDKGVKEFIEAAQIVKEKNRDVQFWLIGEIDKENPSSVHHDDLMAWIRDPDIHYHGATENIKMYIAKSDCVVLPSYREGMPRVIMEAMAMARPVITTDTAGCRETVDHKVSGYLVPVKNAIALADAMIDFISLDKQDRILMGQSGRDKVLREFDDKIIANQMFEILKEVHG